MTVQGIPCPSYKPCFAKKENRCRILSEVYPAGECPYQKEDVHAPYVDIKRTKELYKDFPANKMAIKIKYGAKKTSEYLDAILELEDCLQAIRIRCLKKRKLI